MRVNTRHKFVFISTPKACTHSIYQVLQEHYSKGLLEKGFHDVEIPRPYRKYFRWTVCRNPYSRAVSLWWSACRLHPPDQYGFRKGCGAADDFRKFVIWLADVPKGARVKEPLMQTQSDWLAPVEPIQAIQMEHLLEGLQKLPFWKPSITIPQLNTTTEKIEVQSKEERQPIERPHWKELCRDPQIQKAVRRWAEQDFKRFGYSVEVE